MCQSQASHTDGELLTAFHREGSEPAFEELVRRHAALVQAACRAVAGPDEADDAAQAVFMALATKASRLEGVTSVAGWLYHVARQTAANWRRARCRRTHHERQAAAGTASVTGSPDPDEAHDLVQRLLDGLPGSYRDAIVLHHLEGLTLEQTAVRLGTRPGTVAARVSRGLGLLRKRLVRAGGSTAVLTAWAMTVGTAAEVSATFVTATVRAGMQIQASQIMAAAGMLAVAMKCGLALVGVCALVGGLMALPRSTPGKPLPPPTTVPAAVVQAPEPALGIGRLGPFWWGRSLDCGEDARFLPSDGTEHLLWCYQFLRNSRDQRRVHGRNNLVADDPALACEVAIRRIRLGTSGAHHFKLVVGYVEADFRFRHGDDADLLHQAACARVCVVLPIRHEHRPGGEPRPGEDYLSAEGVPPPAVLALAAGEEISPAWFQGEGDPHVLADLRPVLAERPRVEVDRDQPSLRFDLTDSGAWRLRLRFVGDGDGAWDLDLSDAAAGCRRAPFALAGGRWALSTFSPGGLPADVSEVTLALRSYVRPGQVLRSEPRWDRRCREETKTTK